MKVLCLVAAVCVVAVAGDDTRGAFGSFNRPGRPGRPGSGILGSIVDGLTGHGGVHGGGHGGVHGGGHGGVHGGIQGGHGGIHGGIHGGGHGGHGGIGGHIGGQCGTNVPTHIRAGCKHFTRDRYGQYVCDRNQKPAYRCPPVRPECPLNTRFGPPIQCTLDTDCPGISDKCCCDACLSHPVCKPSA
ncbi:eggshell protein 1-like [Portunus trituberculatus]|uniref:Crustin-2 n=1 Tax=Portunus trituberculatus TaxID=210409 RepID=A0A977SQF9_PORTR|nr:eggshell protein 1-like [Portunus trituberculatus]UXP01442.1 Crustin-2 [Portunus trituberculatus]